MLLRFAVEATVTEDDKPAETDVALALPSPLLLLLPIGCVAAVPGGDRRINAANSEPMLLVLTELGSSGAVHADTQPAALELLPALSATRSDTQTHMYAGERSHQYTHTRAAS